MVLALLSALLGFAQDDPKLDLAALLRGDLSGVERAWGEGAETLHVPGEFALSLADVRALTPSKARGLPGAARASLAFGDPQSSKGGVNAHFAEGNLIELTFQFLGSDVGWKSVLAKFDAPQGKLWWDADSGRSSSRDIAVRLDVPEAQGWKLDLNEYRFYDEDGLKTMTFFTAARKMERSPPRPGWSVGFDEKGAFQSVWGDLQGSTIEATAKRFGIEPGTFDQTTTTPEWMPPGTSQATLRPKSADWGGFEVILTIRGDKVYDFAIRRPAPEEN
jgi:hypothetical protein